MDAMHSLVMPSRFLRIAACAAAFILAVTAAASAQSHVALVIGNGTYQAAPAAATAAVDAEIVAETLRGAGYDVTELHDLHKADIGQAMRGFLDKAAAAGPEGAAIFYYAGHAAQSGGANYLIPVDAVINRAGNVAEEAFRLDDLIDELAKLPVAARVVILDASRDHKFGAAGAEPVPKGLAAIKAVPNMLIAFAAAPGAVAAADEATYSAYTGALVTQMRQPGLDIEAVIKATQQQINKSSAGKQMPWLAGKLPAALVLFAAPPPPPPPPEPPAPAQAEPAAPVDTSGLIDMSKVPCQQFLALKPADIGTILAWLDGYYKGKASPPVFDSKVFIANAKKLAEYCVAHPKSGLTQAMDTLLKKPAR